MDQDNKQKDRYFVAVKVFLEKDDNLLIMKDAYGVWDLPGGRIKKGEFSTLLEQIVRRKMIEEVGSDLKYKIESLPKIFMRHTRQEQVGDDPEARIFALGFMGKFISGEIKLSPAHIEFKWVDIGTFVPEDYFTGGWLTGVRDYLKLKIF